MVGAFDEPRREEELEREELDLVVAVLVRRLEKYFSFRIRYSFGLPFKGKGIFLSEYGNQKSCKNALTLIATKITTKLSLAD